MSTPATNYRCCDRPGRRSLVGPIVLITLGVIFLLSEFDIVRFHDTWPVLLIVIGVAILLQRSGVFNAKESSDSKEVKHV